jgi:hypothetical protein
MNFHMFAFCMLVFIAPIVGCSTGENSSTNGAGDAAPPDAAQQDATPATLDCPSYCAELQANCTGGNAQYPDMETCLATCASFEVGTSTVTDTTGNTLGCRIYHGGAPAKMDPGTECLQAGPAGAGAQIPDGGALTGCSGGDICLSYCVLEIKACGSLDAPLPGDPQSIPYNNSLYEYRNITNCLERCDNGLDTTHPYTTMAVGDSLACRLKEATLAAISVESGQMHCPNTGFSPLGPCVGAASP